MSLEYSDRSDVGLRRSSNQDSRAVLEPWSAEQYRRRGWLFVVADGMGAHAAGETASAMAVAQLPATYAKLAAHSPPLALQRSFEEANAGIHAEGERSVENRGMGTTCTALVLVPRGVLVGHVGDSRAYRVRQGRIEQLSRDHSLVWELEEQRGRAEETDLTQVPKNIITRSMGPHPQVKVDHEGPHPVEPDDVYLLCTDGLSGQVSDPEIGLLAGSLPTRDAAGALVGLALARGGPDNVTVIVVRPGAKEITAPGTAEEAWPLEAATPIHPHETAMPWVPLTAAAVSLLGALCLFPHDNRLLEWGPVRDWLGVHRERVGSVGFLSFLLAFVVSFLLALLRLFPAPAASIAVLPAGRRLGAGPYRSHECHPTPDLVGAMIDSVVSAAHSLDEPARADVLSLAAKARALLVADDLAAALPATAAALTTFARCIETARTA
jgi:serine/threonine protein phosphatase PrpC